MQALHAIGSDGLRPDLTILLTVDAETALERTRLRDGGGGDAIGNRDAPYHRAVSDTFARLAGESPSDFAIIPGDEAPETVHQAIMRAIAPLSAEAA